MIETVTTFKMIEENCFTNSAPIHFMCKTANGYADYYVKYIQELKEFDCLVYEMVCQRLAGVFTINTPDIALVDVEENSFEELELVKNRDFFKSGITAFGSKGIEYNDMLNRLITVPDKKTFKGFADAEDLVKIAVFDMHTDNRDRHEDNFNILIERGVTLKFYAIDHFYCFGGATYIGKFSNSLPIDINRTILRSNFFLQMAGYMTLKELESAIENYFYLYDVNVINTTLDEVFSYIPGTWQVSDGLKKRIFDFLTDNDRLEQIRTSVKEYIRYIKRKG